MALAKVQGTGRKTAASVNLVNIPFSTNPILGNGIVIVASMYYSGGGSTFTCTDNFGNIYTLVQRSSLSNSHAMIFYCSKILTTGALIATITSPGSSYFEVAGIEYSGVGSGLAVDQSIFLTTSSTTTPATGSTSALTASDVIVVSVLSAAANQSSITVQSVSPTWIQEYENLNHSATVAGEGVSRILSSATGTTQSCSWTISTIAGCSTVLAVFKETVVVGTSESIQFSVVRPE